MNNQVSARKSGHRAETDPGNRRGGRGPNARARGRDTRVRDVGISGRVGQETEGFLEAGVATRVHHIPGGRPTRRVQRVRDQPDP